MSSMPKSQTHIEEVLVEVTSLLLERGRLELERELEAAGELNRDQNAVNDLRRMQELDAELRAIRQEFGLVTPAPAPASTGRQVSKFYEVPGQEDA
jgi:hypothetical protein